MPKPQLAISKGLLAGFIVATSILLTLGIYSFVYTQRLIDTALQLGYANQVINAAQQILSRTTDMETAQRGFVITGDSNYLQPHANAIDSILLIQKSIRQLTENDKVQQQRVQLLESLVSQKAQWINTIIQSRLESFDKAQELVLSNKGKLTMDKIRAIVNEIQEHERQEFVAHNQIGRVQLLQFQFTFIGALIIALIIIAILFFSINATLTAKMGAEKKLKEASSEIHELYDKAPCGYLSVGTDIKFTNVNMTLLNWLGYSREEVIGKMKYEDFLSTESREKFIAGFERDFEEYKTKGYVNNLEFDFKRKDGSTFPVIVNSAAFFDSQGEFVKSSTSVFDNTEKKQAEKEIHALNKELESFSYSVSHDLRAPLRSINGYAKILEEEYGNMIGESGRNTLDTIMRNAKRMGQLIDDLLSFSRASRKELHLEKINMHDIVQSVVEEELMHTNGHKTDIKINKLAMSMGDRNMIRQVWVNLVSNAFKYSRRREVSIIEVGCSEVNGSCLYHIRDNGAGFNMQYSHKLFEVFQRLHREQDFEGTGVGLALVKRIITRHGGEVWAESQVNEGATFYFTLPKEET